MGKHRLWCGETLPEPSNKPKQSIPFWANDWRKKHKR